MALFDFLREKSGLKRENKKFTEEKAVEKTKKKAGELKQRFKRSQNLTEQDFERNREVVEDVGGAVSDVFSGFERGSREAERDLEEASEGLDDGLEGFEMDFDRESKGLFEV